jgi:hypothetical protein
MVTRYSGQTRVQHSLIDQPFLLRDLEKEEVVRKLYYNLQKIHALWRIAEAVVKGIVERRR